MAAVPDAEIFPIARGGYGYHRQDIGHVWIKNQAMVYVCPAPGGSAEMLRLFILGSIMAFVLQLRGALVLHAAAVEIDGGAILFAGPTGAGKSTMAALCATRGRRVLTDDMIALFSAGGPFVGFPGASSFKLWTDSLDALSQKQDMLRPVFTRVDKFFWNNPAPAAVTPHPLRAIFGLCSSPGAVWIERCNNLESLDLIAANTYRMQHVEVLQNDRSHFSTCARMATSTPVFRLFRPLDLKRLAAAGDEIDAQISKVLQ
jgi:hypothetical protein